MAIILTLMIGLFIGYEAPIWATQFIVWAERRKILKEITPVNAEENKLCKGRHAWIKATTLTDKGHESTDVCRVCGLISGTNKVATQEGIDRIEENNKIRELEKKLYQEFVDLETQDIKSFLGEELKNGLPFDKIVAIHNAGMTFSQRYTVYKTAKADEITKELTKADA